MRIELTKHYVFDVNEIEPEWFSVRVITPFQFTFHLRGANIEAIKRRLREFITTWG